MRCNCSVADRNDNSIIGNSSAPRTYPPSSGSNASWSLPPGLGVDLLVRGNGRKSRKLDNQTRYSMTQTNRSLLLGLGLLTLVSTAMAQNSRPNQPPLPLVALKGEAAGEAAITALADQLPAVARHYGLSAERL